MARRPPPVLLLALAAALRAPAASVPPPPALLLGSAWYPERESQAQVELDLRTMQEGGLRVARVGEFAWDRMEPEEGRYTFEWLDRAISQAAAHGIYIVLGTPTDIPPPWLEDKYPDTIRVDINGRLMKGGGRSFSYASPTYRRLCREIVAQLARRYGRNPDVVGWQIGNEPTEESYDPAAVSDFHAWLQARYGRLDALNRHEVRPFASWDAIPLPGNHGPPELFLDYKRFVSSEWTSFHANQAETIRRYADPRQFITSNFGGLGWADRFNRHQVAQVLDLASWDDYVGVEHFDPVRNASTYESLPHFDPWRNGATHDLVRGWRQRNFWVMEMQPAFVNWAPVSNAVDRGVVRDMVWQAIGHGADGISFWQWRAGPKSIGPYHGSLVGPDTTPRPVFAEVAQAAAEMAAASPAFAGTSPKSEVAILHDYDSRWAIDLYRQSARYDQVSVLLGYYRALRRRAQSVDIVDPSCDLSQYRLIAAPSLNILSPELAGRLTAYVEHGGCLLLGPRSGMMSGHFELNLPRGPGPLVPELGGRVEEYYALVDDVPVDGAWGSGTATIWAELLSAQAADAKTVLRYGAGNGWLAGQPAALERRLGRGQICYLGAVLDGGLMDRIARALCDAAGVDPAPIDAPDSVEVCRRVGSGREVFVLINHGRTSATVRLPAPMADLIRGRRVDQVTLGGYDVAVLSRSHE